MPGPLERPSCLASRCLEAVQKYQELAEPIHGVYDPLCLDLFIPAGHQKEGLKDLIGVAAEFHKELAFRRVPGVEPVFDRALVCACKCHDRLDRGMGLAVLTPERSGDRVCETL